MADCIHHWHCEPDYLSQDGLSKAICRKCGEVKWFKSNRYAMSFGFTQTVCRDDELSWDDKCSMLPFDITQRIRGRSYV